MNPCRRKDRKPANPSAALNKKEIFPCCVLPLQSIVDII